MYYERWVFKAPGGSQALAFFCHRKQKRTAQRLEVLEGRTNLQARILAIDFGMKRMGLAISDALGITAQGLQTLQRTNMQNDVREIQKLVEEYSAGRVLLGNPLGHGGNETAMSQRVAAFAEKLRRKLNCPVELWDERLTSVEANRMLRDSGIGLEKRKRAVDRVAVTLLLQSYLDYQAGEIDRHRVTGAGQ